MITMIICYMCNMYDPVGNDTFLAMPKLPVRHLCPYIMQYLFLRIKSYQSINQIYFITKT